MAEGRKLGKAIGRRLFDDQEDWLAEMGRLRSADASSLVRAAVDHYRPVYESLSQVVDLNAQVLDKARAALDVAGPEAVERCIDELLKAHVVARGELEAAS